MAKPGYAESLARGAGNGATLGWGDEGAAALLDWLPKPADPDGYDRQYASGSPQADYRAAMRQDLEAAREANPKTFMVGEIAGAAPGAIASGAGGGVAGAVARGAVSGGVAGAGNASGGQRVRGAVQGAATGAALGGLVSGAGAGLRRLIPRPGAVVSPPTRTPELRVAPVSHAEQLELPMPGPEYSYHSTPTTNVSRIAERGLSPAYGGKNFDLAKNRGVVYFSPEEAIAQWKRTIGDVSGEGTALLRTTKPTAPVQGANAAVRVRTQTVPPERLEMLNESTGGWEPLPSPRAAAPLPSRPSTPPEMPAIPRPGRLPSPIDENVVLAKVARGDQLDDLERAAREARFAPGKEALPDPQLERLRAETDLLSRSAKTVPPKRARARTAATSSPP